VRNWRCVEEAQPSHPIHTPNLETPHKQRTPWASSTATTSARAACSPSSSSLPPRRTPLCCACSTAAPRVREEGGGLYTRLAFWCCGPGLLNPKPFFLKEQRRFLFLLPPPTFNRTTTTSSSYKSSSPICPSPPTLKPTTRCQPPPPFKNPTVLVHISTKPPHPTTNTITINRRAPAEADHGLCRGEGGPHPPAVGLQGGAVR